MEEKIKLYGKSWPRNMCTITYLWPLNLRDFCDPVLTLSVGTNYRFIILIVPVPSAYSWVLFAQKQVIPMLSSWR